MTTILQEAAAGRARIVPWTVDQYHSAISSGIIAEDTSVELLDGLIVRKDRSKTGEDPITIGDRHRVAVLRLAHAAPLFESGSCFLQTQQPISLPPVNEPEPDGAVVRGRIDDYLEHPPRAVDVLCVIEVADSSLAVDRGPKLKACGSARVPQYVVVDLVHNRVLVHTDPGRDSYAQVTTLERGATVAVMAGVTGVSLSVDQFLP